MKKMMMFLMVSVFFLMGGMTESMAQKEGKNSVEDVIVAPKSVNGYLGQTITISFIMKGVTSNWGAVVLVFQRPGDLTKNLVVLYRNGDVVYSSNVSNYRLSISADYGKNVITVTIYSIRPEDEGIYYLAAQIGDQIYYSAGTMLTVLNGRLVCIKN